MRRRQGWRHTRVGRPPERPWSIPYCPDIGGDPVALGADLAALGVSDRGAVDVPQHVELAPTAAGCDAGDQHCGQGADGRGVVARVGSTLRGSSAARNSASRRPGSPALVRPSCDARSGHDDALGVGLLIERLDAVLHGRDGALGVVAGVQHVTPGGPQQLDEAVETLSGQSGA